MFVDLTIESDAGQGGVLYPYIIGCFLLLFVLCIFDVSFFKEIRVFSPYLIPLVLIVIMALLVFAVFNDSIMLIGDVRPIAISIVSLIIGYYANLSNSSMRFLVFLFSLVSFWVGIEQVFIRGGGLVIGEYFADSKNQLGPLLMTATIASLAMVRKKDYSDIVFILLSLGCVVITLTIRARAAVLAGAVSIIVYLLMKNKKRGAFYSIIITLLIIVSGFLLMPDVAKQYIYDSFFSGYSGGDVTSGRVERNEAVIDFLSDNLMTGRLGFPDAHLAIAHNYLLYLLYKYGVLFSIPLLILYFVIIVQSLKYSLGKIKYSYRLVGIVAMYIPYVVSLFEYTFPYGPGTATTFNFILFGISLRHIRTKTEYELKQ